MPQSIYYTGLFKDNKLYYFITPPLPLPPTHHPPYPPTPTKMSQGWVSRNYLLTGDICAEIRQIEVLQIWETCWQNWEKVKMGERQTAGSAADSRPKMLQHSF